MSEHYYLALLIPIAITAIFYFIKKREFSWWEFFIPIGSVLIAIVISKVIIDTSSVRFTEYWGSSVVGVYEEEPYNYWQHQTCSYTTTDSKGNSTTHYYDCSHQVDVGSEWYAVTDIKEQFSITEKQHDELLRQFKTKKTVIDSRRNHDSNDRCVGSKGTKFEGKQVGDISYIYQTVWGGQDETRKAYVSQHIYVNKIKASDLTIFNISLVDEKQADSLKLFRYPEHKSGGWFSYTNGLDFPTILGGKVSDNIQEKFKRLNGKFGVSNEMRMWVLIFENQPQSIARYQENYWVKGNMNELVLCIGTKDNQINWAHTFSWALSNELTIDIRDRILNLYQYKDSTIKKQIAPPIVGGILRGRKMPSQPAQFADTTIKVKYSNYPVLTENTWNDLYGYLNNNLDRFQRRKFEEFNYLTVNPSTGAIIFIFILAIVLSLASNFWIISNEFWGEVENIKWNKIAKKIKKLFRRSKNENYE